MNDVGVSQTIFMTVVRTLYGKTCARLLIESLRTFGGAMQNCPFWLFEANSEKTSCRDLENMEVKVITLETPEPFRHYLFGDKVYACAQAETLAPTGVHSLVWIDPNCFIVQAPSLYALKGECDAAFRPVHICNVGSLANQPPNAYWQKIYAAVGVKDLPMTVESFVDGRRLRAYFNSHGFSINPAKGLMKRWLACFETQINDLSFQSGACQDDVHKIFLFQAILSTVVAGSVEAHRIRVLPPEYNYPYNLQEAIPVERRAQAFNDLVSFTYEDLSMKPQDIKNIEIREPLLGWLMQREDNLPQGV
jgi:hypothetical protein